MRFAVALALALLAGGAQAQSQSRSPSLSASVTLTPTPLPDVSASIKFTDFWSYLDTGAQLTTGGWNSVSYDSTSWAVGRTPAGEASGPGGGVLCDPRIILCVACGRLWLPGHHHQREFWTRPCKSLHYYLLPEDHHRGPRQRHGVSPLFAWLAALFFCFVLHARARLPLRSYTGIMNCNIGDGVVVYMNGVEVGRPLMPSGTITATTFANTALTVVNTAKVVTIPDNLIFNGSNIIAVEVCTCVCVCACG